MCLLESLGVIFSTNAYCEAASAALAAIGPDSEPGRQLADCLLDFMCCLAELGPPASCIGAPAAGTATQGRDVMRCLREYLTLEARLAWNPFSEMKRREATVACAS